MNRRQKSKVEQLDTFLISRKLNPLSRQRTFNKVPGKVEDRFCLVPLFQTRRTVWSKRLHGSHTANYIHR